MGNQGISIQQAQTAISSNLAASFAANTVPPQADLVGFHGREALSRPYRFDLGLSVPQDIEIDIVTALGQRGLLQVDRGGGNPPFVIHGVLAAMEFVAHYESRSLYLATLVPQLWQLTLTHHSRVFTDGTIPEIIEAVLKDSGLLPGSFVFRLSQSYPSLEHVCQYRESNLAFISRLMEREGMCYYFEQGEQAEQLIITDDRLFHQELGAGIMFAPWDAQQSQAGKEVLNRFRCKASALPTKVMLNDYDFLNPTLDLHVDAPVASSSPGQIVLYGENYQTPAVGQQYAKIRAEEYLARQEVYDGRGFCWDVRPGYLFKLEQHPLNSFNASYLTSELEHWSKQVVGIEELDDLLDLKTDDLHRIALKAIAADVQFRPRRTTPWPRVDGVVDGVVDGPASSPYAQIDEHGRYKVKIFFDESDLLDGSASTWIRMLQPHGGGTEGLHFPLRKGTEVHIVFLGGDPDRPVITGVAPNTQKPSKVTSANHSQNVVMTGGSNRMEMEDLAGSQYIDISCPVMDSYIHLGSPAAGKHSGGFSVVTSTLGRWKQYSLLDRLWQVDSFSVEQVKGDVTQTYQAKLTQDVTAAVTITHHDIHDWTIDKPVTWLFKDTFDHTIKSDITQCYEATVTQDIVGDVTITIHANVEETVDGEVHYETGQITETHHGNKSTSTDGTQVITAAGGQDIHSDTSQNISAPEQTIAADNTQALTATDHTITGSATIAAQAPDISITGSGTVVITGGNVTIEGGSTTIKGGTLGIEYGPISIAGSPIAVDGGGQIDMKAGLIKLN